MTDLVCGLIVGAVCGGILAWAPAHRRGHRSAVRERADQDQALALVADQPAEPPGGHAPVYLIRDPNPRSKS